MKLEPKDLLSLEEYDSKRDSIKKELISHKKNRTINIGDNIVLIFEAVSYTHLTLPTSG